MTYLALDIGGSAIKHALITEDLAILSQGSVPGRPPHQAALVETVGAIYDQHAAAIDGMAISTAGELDPATGQVFGGGALHYNTGTNLLEAIAARCPTRLSIENDANCALLAEVGSGSLVGCRDAAMVVLGTGVGGALLLDGRVHRGSRFHAGGFSFVFSDLDGPHSLGDLLGTSGSVRGMTEPMASYAGFGGRLLTEGDALDGRRFFAELDAGNEAARLLFDAFCGRLATFLFNLQSILDLDAVAIGGGISAHPALVPEIARRTASLYTAIPVPITRADIRAARYRNDSNLIGAVVHFLDPSL